MRDAPLLAVGLNRVSHHASVIGFVLHQQRPAALEAGSLRMGGIRADIASWRGVAGLGMGSLGSGFWGGIFVGGRDRDAGPLHFFSVGIAFLVFDFDVRGIIRV